MAVADAYSAITSERVYRASRSRQEALAELDASAGTHLDPAIVRVLRRVLDPASVPEAQPQVG